MLSEFNEVIKTDQNFAKSLSNWIKSSLYPKLHEEIDSALKKYKEGKVRLLIPETDVVFNPKQHEFVTGRKKEMNAKGCKISKIVRPGIIMIEHGRISIISRAQVEIKT